MKNLIMLVLICAMLLGTLSGCWGGWLHSDHHHYRGWHFVQNESQIINDHSFNGIHLLESDFGVIEPDNSGMDCP